MKIQSIQDVQHTVVNLQRNMYEEQDCYDKAIQLFGTRVSMICAMEMARKLDAETAYANIKYELKALKKVRKLYQKNSNCHEECE